MPIESGTLAYVNYTAKVKETGEILEVTKEEEAKKLAVHDPSQRYEPRLVAIGEGWVLKGLDEALMGANLGESITVEIPPDKAFGVRDANKVKMIPIRKFGERASELRVGQEVEVDNRIGIVRFIGSGRAQVDFNHRLAGKTIIYDAEVVKKLEGDQEKIMALLRRRLPIEEAKVNLTIEEDAVKILLPSEVYLAEGLQIVKKAFSNDVFKFVKSVSKVYFTELYETKKPEAEKPEVAKPEVEKPEGPPAQQEAAPEEAK